MSLNLIRKVALVTGATQGLGFAIAEGLLVRGADVLICARTEADLTAASNRLNTAYPERRVLAQVADVSKASDVEAVMHTLAHSFGTLDILVNNAGRHGAIGPLAEVDMDAWIEAIELNLVGVARLCQAALKHFKQSQKGKIINVSGGGATAPQYGLSAYAASKAGLVRLTETLALECKGKGIDINALAPGALVTRLTKELADSGPGAIGPDTHEGVIAMRARGGGSLSKAADLCAYLASSDSDGLSGRLISAVWDPWPFSPEQVRSIMAFDIYTLRRIVPEDRGQKW